MVSNSRGVDDQTRRLTERLGEIESRLNTLWNIYHAELRTSGRARDRVYAELDALIAEVHVLQAALRGLQERLAQLEATMTNEQRSELMTHDLTRATAALVRLCWPDNEKAPAIVDDFLAELLGRTTALSAGTVVTVHTIAAAANAATNARLAAVETDVAELKERAVGGDGK